MKEASFLSDKVCPTKDISDVIRRTDEVDRLALARI